MIRLSPEKNIHSSLLIGHLETFDMRTARKIEGIITIHRIFKVDLSFSERFDLM
jgi:hypothetical protein